MHVTNQHTLAPKPIDQSKYKPHCKPEEWTYLLDLNSSKWLFFEIAQPAKPWPGIFKEMCPLTPNQCLWAIHHVEQHGGQIELYLTDGTRSTYDAPYVGLVFDQTGYTGYGLGSPFTEDLETELEQYKGVKPSTILTQLHDIFKRYTQHRCTVLRHPDTVSGTAVVPDYWGKPVKFHWTEDYSDVIIEYPDTGLEDGYLESIPYSDPRPAVLDAVRKYGSDDARDMNAYEQRLWASARA